MATPHEHIETHPCTQVLGAMESRYFLPLHTMLRIVAVAVVEDVAVEHHDRDNEMAILTSLSILTVLVFRFADALIFTVFHGGGDFRYFLHWDCV